MFNQTASFIFATAMLRLAIVVAALAASCRALVVTPASRWVTPRRGRGLVVVRSDLDQEILTPEEAEAAGAADASADLGNDGVDMTRQDSDGDTPLHKAAAQGHQATTHMLASRCSAAAALRDRKGRTPEDVARSEELGKKLRAQLAGQGVPSQEAEALSASSSSCT